RVVYEPRAVLDHFEFGSSEKSGQALALQQKNRLLFLEKHQAFLARQWVPDLQNVLAARTRAPEGGTERVLILDDRVPLPPLGAGFPRACHLLEVIAETGRQVTFYPIDRPQESWDAIQQWLPPTVEVALDQGRAGLAAFLKERRGLYDTIIISRPHNMELLRALLKDEPDLLGKARLIYDAEAVFAVREKHRARLFGSADSVARADREIETELKLASIAQRIVTVSPGEAAHFLQRGYRDVHVIGHGIAPHPTPRAFAERHNLLFVGLLQDDASPNVDSLQWFAREVGPRLSQHLSEPVELQAVGRTGAKGLDGLPTGCLRLMGPVEDLTPLYDRSRVFVAPTRFAGGIPHKIHEAAAHGLPVVATSLLAEQLGWTNGVELLTADDPDAFARQIATLYQDEALWTRLRNAALARMAQDCDPQEFARRVQAVVSF
ncbi:MAG: glycosyltransferase family 4 protein, partial [Elstera sp.]